MTRYVADNTANWGQKAAAGSTNWGKRAAKNTTALGLAADVMNPCSHSAWTWAGDPPSIGVSVGFARNLVTPRCKRYATPSHLITVNAVAPGAIDNNFNKETFDKMPESKEMLTSLTNLGRVGKSEDLGGVVAFLCSEEAGWVNAQRIEVSGGIFN